MTTARQRVLAYIKKENSASANEIGRSLGMSTATVRHHLNLLLADGRISLASGKAPENREGRGRPVKRYQLSTSLLGDNLALLSGWLLDEAGRGRSNTKRDVFLRTLARGLSKALGQVPPKMPVAKRLAMVVAGLNEMHYRARWEAGPEGPRVLFGHCPYSGIIREHPELCQMDAFLLEEATGMPAHQRAKILPGPEGPQYCIFLMY